MIRLSIEQVTKLVLATVEQTGLRADVKNPESAASFPCCIVLPPLCRVGRQGCSTDLSFTVEVWDERQFDCLRLFDRVAERLDTLNLTLANNTPLLRDPIGKWRFGGYFECRHNALTNCLERNR